jgi:hypothetical protein
MNIAGWEKSSIEWFYGLKLHIIVNDKGEVLAFCITSDNTDDRVPAEKMSSEISTGAYFKLTLRCRYFLPTFSPKKYYIHFINCTQED